MSFLRTLLSLVVFSISVTCWAEEGQGLEEEAKIAHWLDEGQQLVKTEKYQQAIPYFNKIISAYTKIYKEEESLLFSAKSPEESIWVLLEAYANKAKGAKLVSNKWAGAYYLKGFSLISLQHVAEGKASLVQAIALEPNNPLYLSELGHVYQSERDWPNALKAFQKAEIAALKFASPEERDFFLSRAWRGQAFVFIEQHKLDEAEKLFHRCLELNSNDAGALHELRYIQSLKAKSR